MRHALRVVFWVYKHLSVNYRGKWVVFGSDTLRFWPALLVLLSLFADNDIVILYFLYVLEKRGFSVCSVHYCLLHCSICLFCKQMIPITQETETLYCRCSYGVCFVL